MLPQITKSVLWDTFYEIMALSGNSENYRMKGEVGMNIAEHNVLTLDYWRDEVSYEGIKEWNKISKIFHKNKDIQFKKKL